MLEFVLIAYVITVLCVNIIVLIDAKLYTSWQTGDVIRAFIVSLIPVVNIFVLYGGISELLSKAFCHLDSKPFFIQPKDKR